MPTTVYVLNDSPSSISVDTSVTPALDPGYWSHPSGPVDAPPGPQVEMLWMDRDVGITKGDTWIFTSTATVGGTEVQMQEQVTGTAFSSTIALQIVAADPNTSWQTDDERLQYQTASGETCQVEGQFVSVPGDDYDNVIYDIVLS
mgnify:FL=1